MHQINRLSHKGNTQLDLDANLLRNRVSKLKLIESKMLKKIDKTRKAAQVVRKIKDFNNERMQEKARIME